MLTLGMLFKFGVNTNDKLCACHKFEMWTASLQLFYITLRKLESELVKPPQMWTNKL